MRQVLLTLEAQTAFLVALEMEAALPWPLLASLLVLDQVKQDQGRGERPLALLRPEKEYPGREEANQAQALQELVRALASASSSVAELLAFASRLLAVAPYRTALGQVVHALL